MKPISMSLMVCALAALAGPVLADSMSLTQFKPQVMPVLVEVNTQGHVTKLLPSVHLSPKLEHLLRQSIEQWVVKPASIKGRAVDSQVIMKVALEAVPVKGSKSYEASFAYVSMVQSPFGASAHWAWKDGHELALVSDSATMQFRNVHRFVAPPQPFRQMQVATRTPAPTPVRVK